MRLLRLLFVIIVSEIGSNDSIYMGILPFARCFANSHSCSIQGMLQRIRLVRVGACGSLSHAWDFGYEV